MINRISGVLANGVGKVGSPADVSTVTTIEYDFPPQTLSEMALLAGFAIVAALLIWLSLRDTATLSRGWRTWLLALRLAALAGLFLIALNPHRRTQEESFRPSQVALLVDTSTSMQQPAGDAGDPSTGAQQPRWEAVRAMMADSTLLAELTKTHTVDVYTFDSDLSERLFRFPHDGSRPGPAPATTDSGSAIPDSPDWDELLQPTGPSTRLGDSVDKLLAELQSRSLSGVVVISDGASNVGRDVTAPNRRARKDGSRLVGVGVGGTQPPVNLQIVRIIAPTDVQLGDSFEISALVQSQELSQWQATSGFAEFPPLTVELLRKTADDPQPVVVQERAASLTEDNALVEVSFEEVPRDAGDIEYAIRLVVPPGVPENRTDDNSDSRVVRVFDRPTRILMMAGGPTRDYRFARNALHRHQSIEVDVWLQTAQAGIAQDAQQVLFQFPEAREALFSYDCIIAFDLDWSQVPPEGRALLEEWVSNEGGGLVVVAGDVNTPALAGQPEDHLILHRLLPVVLEELRPQFQQKNRATQPWKIRLTQEGMAAAFLQLSDSPAESASLWEEFPGVYGCYPTNGRKSGATVYAVFADPLSVGDAGPPVLIASQRYSQGNVVYLGNGEWWRLRSMGEEYFDRFWIKLTRAAAEGRAKRGLQRAMLVLDNRDYEVAQTVPLRARVLTASYEPLDTDTISLNVFDPRGRAIFPAPVLTRDRNRATEFVGDLRVTMAGKYRLSLPVPDSSETATGEITVTLPQRELTSLRQDSLQLQTLVEETGGAYVQIEDAAERVPALLPDRGQSFILDQQISELWDRRWVLYLLVGLLSLEWLSRKLLKLA